MIQIKPLDRIKPDSEPTSLEQEYQSLQHKLQATQMELERLEKQKETMLKEARDAIKQKKDKWASEKQILMEQIHEKGYQAGFTHGEQESVDQYKEILHKANKIVFATMKDYHEMMAKSDKVIIDLAIKTAEKIVKREIKQDPQSFLNIVTAAIKEIKDQANISIYVHPTDYEFILQQKNELKNMLNGHSNMSIFIDQALTENSCLIEHPFGQIDASIDTQLQEIRDILQEVTMESKQ